MLKIRKAIALSFILSLPVVAISCRQSVPPKPEDMPEPVSCTIIVKDASDRGVPDVLVKLHPTAGSRWLAAGVTDSAGIARFKAIAHYPGVVPGTYAVLLDKTILIPTGKISEMTGAEIMRKEYLIDETYAISEKTPLSVVVPAEGCTETFRVELIEKQP